MENEQLSDLEFASGVAYLAAAIGVVVYAIVKIRQFTKCIRRGQ